MRSPASSDPASTRRRLIVASVATLTALVVLAGIGIYGLIAGPMPVGKARLPASTPEATSTHLPVVLPKTVKPSTYAAGVAERLFAWNTRSESSRASLRDLLIRDGDPNGVETAGLAADLDWYLPAEQEWQQLGKYRTTQTLSIDRLFIPEQWQQAKTSVPAGTTAFTVEGTRHREGVWDGREVSSAHPVTFTMFITCAPTFDRCHLMRLSQLDKPLR